MRLASYNVENLFARAIAMNLASWAESKPILTDYAKFNALIAKPRYSAADKKALLALLEKYRMLKGADSTYFTLRQNRGRLLKAARGTAPAEITATGRGDWIGWLELRRAPVNAVAIANTARVIRDLNADVIGVVEAEDRPGLKRFSELVLGSTEIGGQSYGNVMLIDGNDDRGIDVGIMTRPGYPILSMISHVNDATATGNAIFSRDCAAYLLRTPGGDRLWILVNHLKSKGYGSAAESTAKRLAQATRVRAIYDSLVQQDPLVAVIGDLNDTPASAALAPLCGGDSPLRDVSAGPHFDDGGRPGTYANGTKGEKIDFILCSPALMERMTGGGIWRLGVWGGKNGTLFPHYPTVTQASEAASDHAAIWADFDL